jgi:hypothetical protein
MKAILGKKEEPLIFGAAHYPTASRAKVFQNSIHKLADGQLPKHSTPRLGI